MCPCVNVPVFPLKTQRFPFREAQERRQVLSLLPLGSRCPASSAAHSRSSPQLQPSAAQLPHFLSQSALCRKNFHPRTHICTRRTVSCSRQPKRKSRHLLANPSIHPSIQNSAIQNPSIHHLSIHPSINHPSIHPSMFNDSTRMTFISGTFSSNFRLLLIMKHLESLTLFERPCRR